MTNDKYATEFWNKKIIDWENQRYRSDHKYENKALSKRMLAAKKLIINFYPKYLLEIGCGSGLLYGQIFPYVGNYCGLDISDVAVNSFKDKGIINHDNCQVLKHAVSEISVESYTEVDLVVSLGLLDWINTKDLMKVVELSSSKKFIHSFSNRSSLFSFFHKIYVYMSYGYKNSEYVPRYYNFNYLNRIFMNDDIQLIKISNLAYIITNL